MKMKIIGIKITSLILSVSLLFSSCASSTIINSDPQGAKLYLNGEYKGETPYTHKDTDIIFTSNTVKLSKEGYKDLNSSFARDEQPDGGAIVTGLFLFWPMLLWAMKYDAERTYILQPISEDADNDNNAVQNTEQTKSKVDMLRELKEILDEGIITEEEYEIEKIKILEGG